LSCYRETPAGTPAEEQGGICETMNVVGFLGGRNLLPEKLRGRFRVPGLLLANTFS
jgi:hypothetical protein